MNSMACLVLASSAPHVLGETVSVYRSAGLDVFVHVDAKVDLAGYREAMGELAGQCVFLEQRVPVFWGGWSMVRAEVSLLKAAMVGEYTHYLLVSDDTLPVMAPGALARFLGHSEDRIGVNAVRSGSSYSQRYYGYYYFDHAATQPRGGGIEAREMDGRFAEKMEQMLRHRLMGKTPLDSVYVGGQFWCLTADTVERLMQIYEDNEHMRLSFEFSALPDELMFQSICGNCLMGREFVGSPVFADFSKGHGPLVYASEADLPASIPERCCFVRKVLPQARDFVARHCAALLKG
jgi:hypothetical protein